MMLISKAQISKGAIHSSAPPQIRYYDLIDLAH